MSKGLDALERIIETFYDKEVMEIGLSKYDWIHLHHEEFTGLTYSDGSKYNEGSFSTKCSNVIPYCFKKITLILL